VRGSGGTPELVTLRDPAGERLAAGWPWFLPDGKRFLFLSWSADGNQLQVGSLDSSEASPGGPVDSRVEYAPPGFLVFVQEGTLMARPWDAGSLRWTGEAIPIAERAGWFHPTGSATFSTSGNGVLVFGSGQRATRLVWVDRSGQETGALGDPGQFESPRLSPDGRKVALLRVDPRVGTTDLWVVDRERDTTVRLTSDPGAEFRPVWSPDGRRLVFSADWTAVPNLHVQALDGSPASELLPPTGTVQVPTDWSADGRFILYMIRDPQTQYDLWILPLSGERKPVPFLRTPAREIDARASADGRWVAYVSDESGREEVYVSPLASAGERWRVSSAGGNLPRWRWDGRELFYRSADGHLMAAPVRGGADFEAGAPVALFRVASTPWTDFDVTPDGQAFLTESGGGTGSLPLTVVIHFTAGLAR